MLEIHVPESEQWDEKNQVFVQVRACDFQLEHSLISLSKWESKWCTPFLTKNEKTYEQTIDYIRCMTVSKKVDSSVYYGLTTGNLKDISEYINAPMTATTFREVGGRGRNEIVTAELVYYWMIVNNIPMECEKWHLNRLMTLIRVCSIKNSPSRKMSAGDIARQNRAVNAARRKKYGTKG